MTTNLRELDEETLEALPDMEENFASPALLRAVGTAETRMASAGKGGGGRDASRQSTKSPGARDASKRRSG